MRKCRHQNGTVVQILRYSHNFDVVDGQPAVTGGDSEPDTHQYSFECQDCGKTLTFRPNMVPNWLNQYLIGYGTVADGRWQ